MRTGLMTITALLVVSLLAPLTTASLSPSLAPQAADEIPRMPDGKPNFTGLWQYVGTANWDLEDHPAQPGPFFQLGAVGAIPAGQSVVVGGEIPYQESALAQKEENFENRWTLDPEIKCYMPGIPRATYMPYPFQIIQSTNNIAVAYEYATASRVIRMTNHTESPVDSWMGWSNGRWEGDTLVVEVTGFNDQTWFDRAGNFHSNALRVVERYTYRNPDVIDYEATIEDPNVFTRPWAIRLPLYRRLDENAQLLEFKCVEFAEELIYGHLRKQTDEEE